MARTSVTILNKSTEGGHPCLVLGFKGNAFSFAPLSYDVSCGLVMYGLY